MAGKEALNKLVYDFSMRFELKNEYATFVYSLVKLIEQDLERLEEIDKAQEIEFNNLEFSENENKYQTSIRVLKEAFIALGKGDIANTCWFKYLEELEKENQELEKKLKIANKNNATLIEDSRQLINRNLELQTEKEKLKKALEILKTYIDCWTCGAEYDFDTFVTSRRSDEEQDLLKEVLRE